jgi:WD40 repeat protein
LDGPVERLAYSADGRTLAVAGGHRREWNQTMYLQPQIVLLGSPQEAPKRRLARHRLANSTVAFLNGDRLVAAGADDGLLAVWTTETGEFAGEFLRSGQAVIALAAHPSKPWLYSGDAAGQVWRWDAGGDAVRSCIRSDIGEFTFYGGVKELRPLPKVDGLAVAGFHLGISVWRAEDDYQQAAEFPVSPGKILIDADVSADLKRAAFVQTDRGMTELCVHDVETGRRLSMPAAGTGLPTGIRYSPDGRIMAESSNSGGLALRDPVSMKVFPWGKVFEHRSGIGRMAFSANGQTLATSCDGPSVRIWRMPADLDDSRQQIKSQYALFNFKGSIQSLSLAPDGGTVFVGVAETDAYDLSSGKWLFTVPGQEVSCSPDGALIVTGGGQLDAEAVIWDAKTGKERLRLPGGHRRPIISVAFTAEGRHAITGDFAGKLCCWDVETGKEVTDYRLLHSPR